MAVGLIGPVAFGQVVRRADSPTADESGTRPVGVARAVIGHQGSEAATTATAIDTSDLRRARAAAKEAGQSLEAGGSSRAALAGSGLRGSPIYDNDADRLVWISPGANYKLADDLTLNGGPWAMDAYVLLVDGGGLYGGYFFDVKVQLFDGCPGEGGQLIPGTTTEFHGLDTSKVWILIGATPDDRLVPVDDTVWMQVAFSNDYAGWYLAGRAELGSTTDFFAADEFGWECDLRFADYYGGFNVGIEGPELH